MDKGKRNDLALLFRVLAVARPYSYHFWLSIILAIVVTPFSIAQPFLIQLMVDEHIAVGKQEGILLLAGIYVLVLLLSVVLKYCCLNETHLTFVVRLSLSLSVSDRYSASSSMYLK